MIAPRKKSGKARGGGRAAEPGAEGRALQAAFFAGMAGARQFWALFEHLPDVDFFAKDTAGRFVAGNAGLLRRLGLRSEAELIGLRDADIHPARVAREIRADDALPGAAAEKRGRREKLTTGAYDRAYIFNGTPTINGVR